MRLKSIMLLSWMAGAALLSAGICWTALSVLRPEPRPGEGALGAGGEPARIAASGAATPERPRAPGLHGSSAPERPGPSAPVLLIAVSAAAMAAAAGGAVLAAGAVTRPLERLTVAVRRWSHGEFSYRIRKVRPREVGELAEALNQMAGSLWQRDDSIRLDAKDRIQESEKLATIGQLAAGVAHEINNPLGGILLYANLLLESTPEGDPRRENMGRIVAQAQRAREIVRGLLDFSRQTPPRIERVDLNVVLLRALDLLERHPLAQNVRVHTELCPLPLWVHADAPKIEQVFINIVVNAFEAMNAGGVLTVRSGYSERNRFCRVAITDTGPGIPEEHRARLFEPFFTTKAASHGVGLGLAISYGIVRQHGGSIEVQSGEGLGATFRVLLPVERGLATEEDA